MNSVVVRVKDEKMRNWLLAMEMIEIEGGTAVQKYEKVQQFVRYVKSGIPYDPAMVEFCACLRRMREMSSKMMTVARRGEFSLEQEHEFSYLSNELNRLVMYSRRSRT